MAKRKTKVGVAVTGRAVAYIQKVGRGGKLGKAEPVVLTTVRVGAAVPKAKAKKRKR